MEFATSAGELCDFSCRLREVEEWKDLQRKTPDQTLIYEKVHIYQYKRMKGGIGKVLCVRCGDRWF